MLRGCRAARRTSDESPPPAGVGLEAGRGTQRAALRYHQSVTIHQIPITYNYLTKNPITTPFYRCFSYRKVANFALPASTQQVKSSSDPDARNASVWTSYDFIRQFCTLGLIYETSSGTFCRQSFQATHSIFQAHPGCTKTLEANPCYTGICSVSALTAEPFKLTKIISSQEQCALMH
mgnify:FL=1